MKRLTLVTHSWADAAPTGVGRYARELLAALARSAGDDGWAVTAASGPEQGHGSIGGVSVQQLPGPRPLLQAALAAGLPLRWDHRLGRPDLVHQLNPWAPVPTAAPQVLTVHDLMPMAHPEWYERPHRWRFGATLRWASRHARVLVCDSQHVAAQLVDRVGIASERVEVVPCGVDDRFRRPPDEASVDDVLARHGLERGRYLLGLGVMSAREDPSVIVRALERSTVDLAERALVLTGPHRHGVGGAADTARSLGIRHRVHRAGFVPEDDLVPLLAGAAALVHPSSDEGFGFTPLEAMAVGTPVIASDAGSLPETTGGAAVLVDPDDVDGWAAAIERVVGDPGERAALVAAGRRHQAAFTWDRTAARMLEIYDRVVEPG